MNFTYSFLSLLVSLVAVQSLLSVPRVNIGSAEDFVILTSAGISTIPQSSITGNIGVSPAAITYLTGFSLTADATNLFSTSTQVVGKAYGANLASPTPSKLGTAVLDRIIAFTDAKSRVCLDFVSELTGTLHKYELINYLIFFY
jgi:hypothetical protein